MEIYFANVEETVRSRLGGFITQVQEITEDTDQPSIGASVSWAMRKLGYTVARFNTVTDAEIAEVVERDFDVLIDLSELQTLKALPGNLPAADVKVGPQSVTISHLLAALENMIKRRSAEIAAEHGDRLPGADAGRRRARVVYP